MSGIPDISVVVPVYRNPATLAALVDRIATSLATRPGSFEVVFVDDACPDGSAAVLRTLTDRFDNVRVETHSRNLGQNRAVMTGLASARGRVVAVMDADLQDPPEAIPALLDALTGDADAVFGGRRGAYESPLRLAQSRLHKWLLHVASGRRVPVDAGLFVVMTRRMVASVLEQPGGEPYLIALMGRTGLRMASVPVVRAARSSGGSTYTFSGRARLAMRALAITLSRKGAE